MNFAETRILDASTLNDYLHCPRRYYWRHVRSIVKIKSSLALTFGTALHAGMEVAYAWLQENPYSRWTPEITRRARTVAVSSLEAAEDPETLSTEEARNPGKLDTMLSDYFKRYPQENFRVLAVERPFALGVTLTGYSSATWDSRDANDGRLFSWVGQMDVLAEWSYGLKPMDHKTTTMLGQNFERQWSPNIQVTGYIQAATLLFPDKFIFGATINALQVSKLKETQVRIETTRRKDELEAHHSGLLTWAQQIEAEVSYPMNTTSCTAYGECPYRTLCINQPNPFQEDPGIIPHGYREEVWNPIEHIEGGKDV